jgi:hypothetical protein
VRALRAARACVAALWAPSIAAHRCCDAAAGVVDVVGGSGSGFAAGGWGGRRLGRLVGGTHKAYFRKKTFSSNASPTTMMNSVCRHCG